MRTVHDLTRPLAANNYSGLCSSQSTLYASINFPGKPRFANSWQLLPNSACQAWIIETTFQRCLKTSLYRRHCTETRDSGNKFIELMQGSTTHQKRSTSSVWLLFARFRNSPTNASADVCFSWTYSPLRIIVQGEMLKPSNGEWILIRERLRN